MPIHTTGKSHRRAIAIALRNQDAQRSSRIRNAMMFLAVVMLGLAMATSAFAADRAGNNLDFSRGGFHDNRSGFQGPVVGTIPAMPPPVFNQSVPYTVQQTPETPVSPASPGSVFGNG